MLQAVHNSRSTARYKGYLILVMYNINFSNCTKEQSHASNETTTLGSDRTGQPVPGHVRRLGSTLDSRTAADDAWHSKQFFGRVQNNMLARRIRSR